MSDVYKHAKQFATKIKSGNFDPSIESLSDVLEAFADTFGMIQLSDALALMCSAKADHIRANYGCDALAFVWDDLAAKALGVNYEAVKSARTLGED